jgi:hypothetical protein
MAKPGERIHWKREKPPRQWTRPGELTPTENANVMDALWLVHAEHRPWSRVAMLLGVNYRYLRRITDGYQVPGPGMAIRVARLAGLSTDDVLAGDFDGPLGCKPRKHRS